jgi:hypothetical protein
MPSPAAAWNFVVLVAGKELSMSMLLAGPDTGLGEHCGGGGNGRAAHR